MRQACLNTLRELAKRDPRVVFIGSDLSPALCKSETPDRWLMEGVAEQNMIGMAAGMAMDGLIPYCNTIATFLTRRAYDQVVVDLCMHNLPVRLIGNGGGLVYSPLGPTHLAIEDIAIMRALPNMTVVAPCDADEMVRVMEASLDWPGPMYIRMARGGEASVSREFNGFEIGKAIVLRHATDRPWLGTSVSNPVVFISTGAMTHYCLAAALYVREQVAHATTVIHCHTVKPLDKATIAAHIETAAVVVTVEEGIVDGGLGTAVAEMSAWRTDRPPIIRLGIPDLFPPMYGTREEMWESYGLTGSQIALEAITQLSIVLHPVASKAPHPRSLLPTQKPVLGAPSWVE